MVKAQTVLQAQNLLAECQLSDSQSLIEMVKLLSLNRLEPSLASA